MSTENKLEFAKSYRDLEVYKASFRFQQAVFQLTKSFPPEERHSLTDQIRRSSRSIGANIAESWSKRRYPNHFLSKLTDADGELQESTHWLRTAFACDYVAYDQCSDLLSAAEEIGRMLGGMIENHTAFCPDPNSK
jgi:four helix bundle protein